MNITEEHVQSKKEIGTLKGKPVFEVVTTGGLHLVLVAKNGSWETVGTGPHRAISRYIAEKKEPDIVWKELHKSEIVTVETFVHVLPEYFDLTKRIRKLEGSDG